MYTNTQTQRSTRTHAHTHTLSSPFSLASLFSLCLSLSLSFRDTQKYTRRLACTDARTPGHAGTHRQRVTQ